jgi:hypothetical protein
MDARAARSQVTQIALEDSRPAGALGSLGSEWRYHKD